MSYVKEESSKHSNYIKTIIHPLYEDILVQGLGGALSDGPTRAGRFFSTDLILY